MSGPVEHRPGTLHRRIIGDREIGVYPLLYGRARLYEGPADCRWGFDEAWDYDSTDAAIDAAIHWDGKGTPPGGDLRRYRR